jgi:hypothetical protein
MREEKGAGNIGYCGAPGHAFLVADKFGIALAFADKPLKQVVHMPSLTVIPRSWKLPVKTAKDRRDDHMISAHISGVNIPKETKLAENGILSS